MKLRLFFVTDIHGSDVCFKKFINSVDVYKAQVLIIGGDITGKSIVPIFNKGSSYEVDFMGEKHEVSNETSLREIVKRIRNSGSYVYFTTKKEWEEIIDKPTEMEKLFNELVVASLKEWIDFAENKLKGKGVICLIQPGNDDSYAIDSVLNSSSVILNSNEKVLELAPSLKVLSLGYSNPTPWNCPRDISEKELSDKIDKLIQEAKSGETLIFNIHVPPFGTGIDDAIELDENMRPKMGPGGIIFKKPVGSTAVREAIMKYQPLLSLHGHIHESKGFYKLGKTLCVNPGSEYQEGILRGVLIQLSENKVKDFLFTSG